MRKLLIEFDTDLTFEAWDETKLNDYLDFLREKDMRNSSIEKQIDFQMVSSVVGKKGI